MPGDGIQERIAPAKPRLTREQIAQRTALELPDGGYVNLDWGIPNLIADYLPKEITVYFHSENGILGMGRRARPGEEDFDQVDAMKIPVTLIPGASFFHQADAHLMSRGGHLDVAVLGGFQVSEKGDLSNWKIPDAKDSGGIGGAMDIAAGAKTLIVCMEHTTKDGAPKIVKKCTYPLTGFACQTGQRIRALLHDFRSSVLGGVLHAHDQCLGARGDVHGSTATARVFRAGNFPVRKIALLRYLKSAQNGNIQMSATRHQMCVRLMKERSARNQRHGHFHRVHLVEIFLARFCSAPHSQNSVFAVEINGDFLGQIVRDEIGNSPAEIYIRAIRQLERGALRDLFPGQSRLSQHDLLLNGVTRHDLFMCAVTRHNEVLSLARCDERRSPGSSRVPDRSYPPARFLPPRRWSSSRPWP